MGLHGRWIIKVFVVFDVFFLCYPPSPFPPPLLSFSRPPFVFILLPYILKIWVIGMRGNVKLQGLGFAEKRHGYNNYACCFTKMEKENSTDKENLDEARNRRIG
jgi:hypothetical protein